MLCGIYLITNKVNGKKYVGQSQDVLNRWKQHLRVAFNEKAHNHQFALYCALRKYGVTNFTFEIIELCDSSILNEREVYWVEHYHSYTHGYNCTRGGDGTIKIDRKLVQKLWDDGFSPKSIREKLGISQTAIISALKNCPTYTAYEAQSRSQQKCIDQYDLDGNYIQTFQSIDDAAKDIQCNRSCISRVLMGTKGKQSVKGFIFRYHGDPPPEKYQNHQVKPVNQYDLSGKYITTFDSISAASRKLQISISCIANCIEGYTHSSHGYMFRYRINNDMSDIEPYKKKKTGGGYNTNGKAVQQYTLDGVLIATFPSLSEVKRRLGLLPDEISLVCRGIKKTYRGFIWKFQGDDVA